MVALHGLPASPRTLRSIAIAGATAAVLTITSSCSLAGGGDDNDGDTVVLLTHDSFALPDEVVEEFEKANDIDLDIRRSGDAGVLTNELVLNADNPLGDVAFGIDNTFASRALDAGVFQTTEASWPDGVEDYALPGDDDQTLAPIDNGNVCVNVDDAWFAQRKLTPPADLDDLVKAPYRDLFVTPGAATSSPGMAFLLATIAEFGSDWPDYWRDLLANGAKLTKGWEDAYQVDFTQGGGTGDRPIVLSYDTSPAFTVDGDSSTTSALLDTCFQQVEYAGVLEGADNPDAAEKVVEWLLSDQVQEALPENMYVFPTVEGTPLPTEWSSYAKQPSAPLEVSPEEIATNRETWLREWNDVTSG